MDPGSLNDLEPADDNRNCLNRVRIVVYSMLFQRYCTFILKKLTTSCVNFLDNQNK